MARELRFDFGHYASHNNNGGSIAAFGLPASPKNITVDIKVIFGVREPLPIRGAPEGKQRLRMRNTRAAALFVKTAIGVRHFILEDCGDHWFCNPRLEQGANLHPK